jgi:hypothetical protein
MATADQPSENMPPRSRAPMQLVAEKALPDPPASLSSLIAANTPTTSSTPKAPTVSREAEFVTRAAWRNGVMGALNLLAIVLAVRLVLLVAVLGALWLAKLALDVPAPVQQAALVMLGVYCVTVVLPMVWLSSRK